MNRNIFITGFSGTGKTSIGEIVSKKTGWDFIDTDNEIVNSTGLSISEIFENCLLYTSPSPRDATLSRMPSSA